MFNVNEITAGNVHTLLSGVTLGAAIEYVSKGGLITLEQDGDSFDVLTKEGAQYTIEPVKGE